jgi:uncharacterized iron-regulated membrane protein
MKKEGYIRLFDLHSWSGVLLGLFIYSIAFTGCLSLFYNELQSWEDPAKRISIAEKPVLMMPLLETWIEDTAANNVIESLTFSYPKKYEPYFRASMEAKKTNDEKIEHDVRWDTHTGVVLNTKSHGLTDWLRDFHRNLMWPVSLGGERLGRFLVGIAGMSLMLLIITGLVLHTRIIKQMFVLRVERTSLLKWLDLHKVLGLWPLPFHVMVSFTGAFLGVISLLSPVLAVIAFKGDTQSLIAAVFGEQSKAVGIEAPMLSVDDVGVFRLPSSGERPSSIVIRNWGDANATYTVLFETRDELASFDSQTFNGVSGEIIKEELVTQIPIANRVTSSISPLHYGNYGNIWVKVVYLILGITLCFVAVSGLIVWVKRRLSKRNDAAKILRYTRIEKLIIGTTLGLPIASISIFHLDKLFTGPESLRMLSTGFTYFIIWIGIIIFSCCVAQPRHKTIHQLFFALATLTSCIPIVNYLSTEGVFWQQLSRQESWVWVDFSCVVLGLLMGAITAISYGKTRNQD